MQPNEVNDQDAENLARLFFKLYNRSAWDLGMPDLADAPNPENLEQSRIFRVTVETCKGLLKTRDLGFLQRSSAEAHSYMFELANAKTYLTRLLQSVYPDVVLLDTLQGLISQIDNGMVAVLLAQKSKADAQFAHFLSYSGLTNESPEVLKKMRQAFDANR